MSPDPKGTGKIAAFGRTGSSRKRRKNRRRIDDTIRPFISLGNFPGDAPLPTQPLVIVASIGAAAVAAAIGVNVFLWQDEVNDRTPATEAKAVAAAKDAAPEAGAVSRPSFDVVRIGPEGDTVMAGRARPGSTVVILDNGKPIGEVTADKRGEWVFVPKKPMHPGSRELTLEMRVAGEKAVTSGDVVVLVVPERGKDIAGRPADGPSGALALKVPRDGGPSILMQSPSGKPGAGLSVETLDYDDRGRLTISGRAAPKAKVNVYLNNGFIGQARADADGGWRLNPDAPIEPGLYTLRADQIDAKGKVAARVSMPFQRAVLRVDKMAAMPEPFVIVQPGNSLWRLARRVYGQGTRYTTIFQANKDQIKDPDLIYPGQVFALPVTNCPTR